MLLDRIPDSYYKDEDKVKTSAFSGVNSLFFIAYPPSCCSLLLILCSIGKKRKLKLDSLRDSAHCLRETELILAAKNGDFEVCRHF